MPRIRPIATAPRTGLPAPRIMVQFRSEAEPIEAWWCSKFVGWMDDREPPCPRIRHDAIGWFPCPTA